MNDIWTKEYSLKYRGGPPLKTPEEVARIIFNLAGKIVQKETGSNVLVLGVTPEIIMLPWASNVKLYAFDKSKEAINHIWKANPKNFSEVKQSDWLSLPLQDHSIDFATGDGCNTQLSSLSLYPKLFSELKRVLKNDSAVITRIFTRPEKPENIKNIIDSAFEGRIKYFGSLKWRIAMCLADDSKNAEVKVSEIRNAFNHFFLDRDELSRITGWSSEIIKTIDVYKDSDQSYTFPTLNEFKKTTSGLFEISDISYGDYELSELCPIVSLKTIN